jgi:hypothetical protein
VDAALVDELDLSDARVVAELVATLESVARRVLMEDGRRLTPDGTSRRPEPGA